MNKATIEILEKQIAARPKSKSKSKEKVDLLNSLAWNIGFSDIENARSRARQALQLAEKIAHETGRADSLLNLADYDDVVSAREAGLPVAVGSGVTAANAPVFAEHADALIVGSWIKQGGDWRRPVDPARVAELAHIVRGG